MTPLLLVTNDKKSITKYINEIKTNDKKYVIELQPEKTEYTIAQIRELAHDSRFSHPEMRIYLLIDFHKSSIPAQNAFLKLLEEPPENTLFILTVRSEYSLLPTIVSRTNIVRLIDKSSLIENQ